jgi:hypothetical protein
MTSPISDILEDLGESYYPWHEYGDSYKSENQKAITEAEQAITALLEAAIGPIEHIKACPANGFTCICPMWQQNKNDCKAEIRQKFGILKEPNTSQPKSQP